MQYHVLDFLATPVGQLVQEPDLVLPAGAAA